MLMKWLATLVMLMELCKGQNFVMRRFRRVLRPRGDKKMNSSQDYKISSVAKRSDGEGKGLDENLSAKAVVEMKMGPDDLLYKIWRETDVPLGKVARINTDDEAHMFRIGRSEPEIRKRDDEAQMFRMGRSEPEITKRDDEAQMFRMGRSEPEITKRDDEAQMFRMGRSEPEITKRDDEAQMFRIGKSEHEIRKRDDEAQMFRMGRSEPEITKRDDEAQMFRMGKSEPEITKRIEDTQSFYLGKWRRESGDMNEGYNPFRSLLTVNQENATEDEEKRLEEGNESAGADLEEREKRQFPHMTLGPKLHDSQKTVHKRQMFRNRWMAKKKQTAPARTDRDALTPPSGDDIKAAVELLVDNIRLNGNLNRGKQSEILKTFS